MSVKTADLWTCPKCQGKFREVRRSIWHLCPVCGYAKLKEMKLKVETKFTFEIEDPEALTAFLDRAFSADYPINEEE